MTVEKLKPLDNRGRRIAKGDWVRLVEIPPSVLQGPEETRSVFEQALGKTFKIEGFDEYGHAELDLSKKVAKLNWIWVEPEHLALFRKRKGA